MPISSVPQLFALARGQSAPDDAAHRCYYCGAPADESHSVAVHVKDSFTGRDGVIDPGSRFVCGGCVLCMDEDAEITLIDGEVKSRATTSSADKPDGKRQKTRSFSWIITADAAIAATKAHIDQLRAICLDPPELPFAVVISDSGQKHLLYRGVVNHAREPITVTLEGVPVTYCPAALRGRLTLCGKLIAATGKPALAEPLTSRFALNVLERFPTEGELLLDEWERVREEPLSALAAWLSPAKVICQDVYPAECSVERSDDRSAENRTYEPTAAADDRQPDPSPVAGRSDGPGPARRAGRGRKGDDPRSRQSTLFGDV